MQNILEQLYYGDFHPEETIKKNSIAYRKQWEKMKKIEDSFQVQLTQEMQEKFSSLIAERIALSSLESSEAFIEGFKLGTNLMLELYYNRSI